MRRDSLILGSFSVFLLASLLVLGGCGRQGSGTQGGPGFGSNSDFGGTGFDPSDFNTGDGELPANVPSLPPNSNGQDQPALPGLNPQNASNGPMNLPISNPSGQDYAQAMSAYQQLFNGYKPFEPSQLPESVQKIMGLWYCQAAAQSNAYVQYASGIRAQPYDVVTGYYVDLLARFPESGGLHNWMHHLIYGAHQDQYSPYGTIQFNGNAIWVALGIQRSQEYSHRRAREYGHHFLRRQPSQATLNNVHHLMSNQKDTKDGYSAASHEGAIVRFMSEYEGSLFWTRAKNAANHQVPLKYQVYAARVMRALLGRRPAAWEVDSLRANKNYHDVSHRRQTVRDVLSSDEFRLKFLTGAGRLFFGRALTSQEYAEYMGLFRQGYDMMSVTARMLASPAYFGRQAQRFNPIVALATQQNLCNQQQ